MELEEKGGLYDVKCEVASKATECMRGGEVGWSLYTYKARPEIKIRRVFYLDVVLAP